MGTKADDPDFKARGAAFEQALQQLGWIQGRNVRIDYRFAGGNAATSRKQAEELVALAPDVIMSTGSFSTGQLLRATRTVPIVFLIVPDPVGSGFVESLSRPGGNATGFMSTARPSSDPAGHQNLARKRCGRAYSDPPWRLGPLPGTKMLGRKGCRRGGSEPTAAPGRGAAAGVGTEGRPPFGPVTVERPVPRGVGALSSPSPAMKNNPSRGPEIRCVAVLGLFRRPSSPITTFFH